MIAAVEAVLSASSGSPFVAVLGEMRELGRDSPSLHFEVGRRIGAAKPGRLIALGTLGAEILKGAQAAGLDESLCFHAANHAEAVGFLEAGCARGGMDTGQRLPRHDNGKNRRGNGRGV